MGEKKFKKAKGELGKQQFVSNLLQDMQAGSPPTPPAANAGVVGVQSAGKLQPGAPMQQPGPGAPPGGFVPGNNYRMNPPPQSPLAYLEKTTSNLGR